jgi:murein DD-endopeptidase MepM/ murein hydrolase activator NlpD
MIPKVASSSFSCTVNIRYDAEAPLNYTSGAPGGNVVGSGNVGGTSGTPVSTSNLGIRTGISNITSSSYKNGEQLVSIPDFANSEFNQNTNNNKNTAITRDTQVQVTTTAEARADMVYTLNSGFGDSINVLIQDNTLNPNGAVVNTGVGGLGGSVGTGSSYKEFGSTLDIKSSKNQQSKQVVLKQDPTKVLLDKNAPFEWYYFFQSVDKSAVKVEPGRISNTTRVLQNGEQDNPTRTTSFTLARNTTVNTTINNGGVDNKNKRDEDGSKKVSSTNNFGGSVGIVNVGSDCTRVTNDAITTSTLGTIPATVNRRVGVCDDGLYKVNTYAVDTVGNVLLDGGGKPVLTIKVIERDTVNPTDPIFDLKVQEDPIDVGQLAAVGPQLLNINLNGEARANALLEIKSGSTSYLNKIVKIKDDGKIDLNDILKGSLPCGSIKIDVSITIFDRAQNVSQKITKSITTKQCPICGGIGSSQVLSAKEGGRYAVNGWYGSNQKWQLSADMWKYPSGYKHYGVDMAGNENANIYAVAGGKVIKSVYYNQDNYKKADPLNYKGEGNHVMIDHGNGVVSWYYHLKPEAPIVNRGDYIQEGQLLGHVGTTGQSDGFHLHFQLMKNGSPIDPQLNVDVDLAMNPKKSPNTMVPSKSENINENNIEALKNQLSQSANSNRNENKSNLSEAQKTRQGCVDIDPASLAKNDSIKLKSGNGTLKEYDDFERIIECQKMFGNNNAITQLQSEICPRYEAEELSTIDLDNELIRKILFNTADNVMMKLFWKKAPADLIGCLVKEQLDKPDLYKDADKLDWLPKVDDAIGFVPIVGDIYTIASAYNPNKTCGEKLVSVTLATISLSVSAISAGIGLFAKYSIWALKAGIVNFLKYSIINYVTTLDKKYVQNLIKSTIVNSIPEITNNAFQWLLVNSATNLAINKLNKNPTERELQTVEFDDQKAEDMIEVNSIEDSKLIYDAISLSVDKTVKDNYVTSTLLTPSSPQNPIPNIPIVKFWSLFCNDLVRIGCGSPTTQSLKIVLSSGSAKLLFKKNIIKFSQTLLSDIVSDFAEKQIKITSYNKGSKVSEDLKKLANVSLFYLIPKILFETGSSKLSKEEKLLLFKNTDNLEKIDDVVKTMFIKNNSTSSNLTKAWNSFLPENNVEQLLKQYSKSANPLKDIIEGSTNNKGLRFYLKENNVTTKTVEETINEVTTHISGKLY